MKTLLLNLLSRLLVIFAVIGGQMLQAQTLNVDIAEDSIYSCLWSSVSISPSVSGQQGSLTWSWNTGDSSSTIDLFSSVVGSDTIIVSVADTSGAVAYDTVIIIVLPECVLPGDADGNGLANNFDVLPIGKSFSSLGPIRPNAHNNFIGQAAPDWGILNSAGVDQVHSDANGDGMVSWQDFEVVAFNYFQAQSMGVSSQLPNAVPFYVDFPAGPYNPGDTIKAPIILGSSSMPAIDIIGIAFSIDYDKSLIDSGSVRIQYSGSWLGDQNIDMAALDKDFYQDGQIDIGISRIDQLARTGHGKIGDIIVAIDDIAGKKEILFSEVVLKHVSLLNQQGSFIDVDTDRSKIQIALDVEDLTFASPKLNLYPNPASGSVQLDLAGFSYSGPAELIITDQLGRIVGNKNIMLINGYNSLDISALASGVYILSVKTKSQIYVNKKLHVL